MVQKISNSPRFFSWHPILIKYPPPKTMALTPVYMSDPIYDSLVNQLRISYPNVCVLYIDRVSNPNLEKEFEKRKLQFTNEKQLFHGTTASSIHPIVNEGYQASYNKRAVFGPGTYFSSLASYSKDYAQETNTGESYLIVNRVLLGNNTPSVGQKYSGDSGGDGKTIYVTKYNDAALPEYVICFYKNATV